MAYKSVSNTIVKNGFVYEIDKYNNVYKYELGSMKYIGVFKLESVLGLENNVVEGTQSN